jgi:hypothetical protein
MAKMYPEDIKGYEKATDGDKTVFRFLKEAARPHKDFICWYEPLIGRSGKKPNFILFSKNLGLLVLEVKDWATQQIISHTPHQFTIHVSGKTEKRTNPNKQAKSYVNSLMERLKKFPDFLSDLSDHQGKLKIPIGKMVVFPNIKRQEYFDRGLQWLIPDEGVFFNDDFNSAGEILCDTSGRKFQERISRVFPFRFKGLTQKEIEKLSLIIWPDAKINLPPRKGLGKIRFQREVLALDESQARLALRLGSGHQIIKGPPGSGKTLVLVHRCCHLSRYNPQIKKILLVCYNIALVGYLRRLIQEKELDIGSNGIELCHFYELCAQILGEVVHYENEDSDYYDLVTRKALERVLNKRSRIGPFDAILVDEGQDFDEEMLKILIGLLRPGGDLVISLDGYQDLYRRRCSWKSLGINASGRTRYLKKVYRNTVEIFEFTQRFIGDAPRIEKQPALLPYDFAFHGDLPELRHFPTLDKIEGFLTDDLRRCIEREGYRRSEIAIIYDDKVYGPSNFAYDNRALPMRILKNLEASGIPVAWVSQDVRSKEMYDVTTDRVSLISIHSAKGLDFDLIYLVGIDRIRPTENTKEAVISLVYVAMTRAKYRLVVPYEKETEIIKKMKECLPA